MTVPWVPTRLFAEGARLLAFSREGDVWVWDDEVPRGRLSDLDGPERGALFGDSFAAAEGRRVIAWSLESMQPVAGFEASAPIRGLGHVDAETLRIVDAMGDVTDLILDGADLHTTSLGEPVDAALVSTRGIVFARGESLRWSTQEAPLTPADPVLGELMQRGHARPPGPLAAEADGLRVSVAGRRVSIQRGAGRRTTFPLFSPVSDVLVRSGRAYLRTSEGDVLVLAAGEELRRLPHVPPTQSGPVPWRSRVVVEAARPETHRPLTMAKPLLEAVARQFRSSGGYREAPARAELHRSGIELQLEVASEVARVTITHDGKRFRVEVATARPAPIPTRPMIRLARILRRREQSAADQEFARDLTDSDAELDRSGGAFSLLVRCAHLPSPSALVSWIRGMLHYAETS